jgi:polar amino acid transport system substrate-binding protein
MKTLGIRVRRAGSKPGPMRRLLSGAALLAMLAGAPAAMARPAVSVCDDEAERPPYVQSKQLGSPHVREFTGFAVDVLTRILGPQGEGFALELLPWRRCLLQVQGGSTDLVLNIARSPEREGQFLFTQPYYQMRLAYFYDKDRPVPTVRSREDLAQQRLCLVASYNYAPFGIDSKAPNVTGTSKSVGQVFQMLKAGRCDIVPERLETAIGYRLAGMADFERLGLAYQLVPGLPTQAFHMGVSPKSPQAQALLQRLNSGIDQLRASGQLAQLAQSYGIAL